MLDFGILAKPPKVKAFEEFFSNLLPMQNKLFLFGPNILYTHKFLPFQK